MGGDLARFFIEFPLCVWKYYKLSLSYLLQSHLFSLLCASIEISEWVTRRRKISQEISTYVPQGQEPPKTCFIAHFGIDEAVQEARGMLAGGGSIKTPLDYGLFDSEQLSKSMAGDSQISHIILSKAVDAAICKGMNWDE